MYRLTEERALADAQRLANTTGKPHYVRYDFAGTQDRWYIMDNPGWWGSPTRAQRVDPARGEASSN